jgi:hypothetical protein
MDNRGTSEDIWSELALLAATIEGLRCEVQRCVGVSGYKTNIETQIAGLLATRDELMAALCEAIPTKIQEPRIP